MDIFDQIKNKIITLLEAEFSALEDNSKKAITAEPPKDASHGDVATNAAMVLSRSLKENPLNLAEKFKEKLETLPHLKEVNIAKPGFINLSFNLKRKKKK